VGMSRIAVGVLLCYGGGNVASKRRSAIIRMREPYAFSHGMEYTTPIRINKNRYIVNNTCSFDSISIVIAMAYLDNPFYKNVIDNSKNQFLEFCKKLVTTNTSAIIQKERLKILKTIFKEDTGITGVNIIDCTCNVLFIMTSLLQDAASA